MFDILLVFIALKLVGAVDWSWGVVCMPIWINIGAIIAGYLWAWWSDLNL